MDRADSIFFNVVDNENRLTELFRNLLRFRAFRDPVMAGLIGNQFSWRGDAVESIEFDQIETQHRLQEGGQPDIEIGNDRIYILVEVKIRDTGLTDNQPGNYVDYVARQNVPYKLVVFLLPDEYAHIDELTRRIADVKGKDVPVVIRTWRQIISIIETYGLHDINPVFAEFYQFLIMWFRPPKVVFTLEEIMLMFDDKVPTIMDKLYQIIDAVHDETSKLAQPKLRRLTAGARKEDKDDEYGIDFRTENGDDLLWFGTWNSFWKKYKRPLVFGVESNKWSKAVVAAFRKRHETELVQFGSWLVVAIDQAVLASDDPVPQIARIINEELEALSSALASSTVKQSNQM